MANRRDHAQAHRFLMRRQTSALLQEHPDGPETPTRRLSLASATGAALAALVTLGFGVYGLVKPPDKADWRAGNHLIVENGTHSRLVYAAGILHPVANYASARLLLGAQSPTVDSVSSAALKGVPRGLPVGIPGAPDELPDTASLLTAPWSTCSIPASDAAGNVAPYVRLAIGAPADGTGLRTEQALLVSAPDGTRFLIWNDQRFRLAGASTADALGYGVARPWPVGAAWLNTVPQGPDLTAPAIPARGAPAPAIGARKVLVGQLFSVSVVGAAEQFYAAYPDGLAPVTATQADLLLGDPASRAAYPGAAVAAIPLSEAELSQAARSSHPGADPAGLPAAPPALAGTAGAAIAVCSVFTDTSGSSLAVSIRILTLTAEQLAATPPGTSPVAAAGGPLADQVVVAPGHGAVVQELPSPGVKDGTVYLVTDLGVKFPLTSTSLLPSLGLPGAQPVPVPAGVLGLLRTGPRLDRADAAQTVAILPDQNGAPPSQIPIPAG